MKYIYMFTVLYTDAITFLCALNLAMSFFLGHSSAAEVTLKSIQVYQTHEWLHKPTVYFHCKGENKTVLPDVKKANTLYTFKGEESWQVICHFLSCVFVLKKKKIVFVVQSFIFIHSFIYICSLVHALLLQNNQLFLKHKTMWHDVFKCFFSSFFFSFICNNTCILVHVIKCLLISSCVFMGL